MDEETLEEKTLENKENEENEDLTLDIQKELEAKFDELFGNIEGTIKK